MLAEKEKVRYNRQLILPNYSEEQQLKLQQSKVLVVGAGGLGSVVLTYLSRVGIGTIGIVEFDQVDITNLHRQVLYNENDINSIKLDIAISNLKQGNSSTIFIPHEEALNENNAKKILYNYDIIADCTDNFQTRYLINDISAQIEKPVVFASVANYEGQVTILNYKQKINYRNIFSEIANNIPIKGILPTLLPIIGGIQANEVIKTITGLGEILDGKLLIYNSLNNVQHILKIS